MTKSQPSAKKMQSAGDKRQHLKMISRGMGRRQLAFFLIVSKTFCFPQL